ncbi:MAG: DUF202 domain-containing protein [Thermoleophilia bacterium]|nr:DUF202 domain-containing protein [Thermoleophilia bacterium]
MPSDEPQPITPPVATQSIIRTELANERTFLAWPRTSLACAAGAAAAAQLLPTTSSAGVDLVLPGALLVASVVCLFAGVRHQRSTHRRIWAAAGVDDARQLPVVTPTRAATLAGVAAIAAAALVVVHVLA